MAEVASRCIENGAATEFTHWHRQEASRRQFVAKEIFARIFNTNATVELPFVVKITG